MTMYLHFQNWSSAPSMANSLDRLQLPHQGEVLKVFSSPEDPRAELDQPALHVVEADGDPFDEAEVYAYERRREYPGPELEEDLMAYDLSQVGMKTVRSLFRFSHKEGFCQAAMAASRRSVWVIKHPFQSIDGLSTAGQSQHERTLHLDIFLPESLKKVLESVDYRDPEVVLPWQDGVRWLQATPTT